MLPLLSWRRPGIWRRIIHRLCCRLTPGCGIPLYIYPFSFIYLSKYSSSTFIHYPSSSHGRYLETDNPSSMLLLNKWIRNTIIYLPVIYLSDLSLYSSSMFIHCSPFSHGRYLRVEPICYCISPFSELRKALDEWSS